jgi:hypothetical protein
LLSFTKTRDCRCAARALLAARCALHVTPLRCWSLSLQLRDAALLAKSMRVRNCMMPQP